jgi:tetratricopeptide (TPR) repeat protein
MRFSIAAIFAAALLAQTTAPPPADLDQLLLDARKNYAKGDYTAARESLVTALAIVEESPKESPKRYDVFKQLAGVNSAAGDYAKAQEYLEYAINWRETILGPADPGILDDLTEQAMLCNRLKDNARGLAILNRVYAAHLKSPGYESSAAADDQSRMAILYMGDKKPDRAAECLVVAIRIREKILGLEHPGLLVELDRLAAAWIATQNYPRAEETFRRALVIQERLVGRDSADLIPTVDGLAYSQFGQKKYEEAEKNYGRLLGLWILSAGESHPLVAITLDKIAMFYREQKRTEEAQAAKDKALALRALFLANGLAQEAGEQLANADKEKKKQAEQTYRRALAVLDPERKEHDELRKSIEKMLDQLKPAKSRPSSK